MLPKPLSFAAAGVMAMLSLLLAGCIVAPDYGPPPPRYYYEPAPRYYYPPPPPHHYERPYWR